MQASAVLPLVVLLAACGSPPAPTPVVQTTAPAASITATGAKRIVRKERTTSCQTDRGHPQTRGVVSGCRTASTLRHSPTAFSCPTVCNVRRTMREDMSAPDNLGRADAGAPAQAGLQRLAPTLSDQGAALASTARTPRPVEGSGFHGRHAGGASRPSQRSRPEGWCNSG